MTVAAVDRPAARRRITGWLIGVGVVTFLAGLLFGYDQGVISGALPLLQQDLHLSTIQSEVITSWVTLGALVAGAMADRLGRRYTAVLAGALFAAGALVETVSPGAGLLTFGRVVVDAIGEATTFFLFALMCVVTFVFVWFLVPETKGRSLEEIQTRWAIGGERMTEEPA